jgi:UPF0755 protein
MVRRKISRKTPGYLRFSLWIVFLAIIVGLFFTIKLYKAIFSPSVELSDTETSVFYIPTGSDFEHVVSDLIKHGIIDDKQSFVWLAEKKNYPNRVKPGRYRLQDNMSNNDLLNLLRSGRQEPVKLSFHNIRTLNDLAAKVSEFIEPDSASLANYLNQKDVASEFGFTHESFPAMFIPNSYEFYWTSTTEDFAERMKREYVAFWSKGRSKKAENLGLSEVEVSVLASIVEQESLHADENPIIAGVFINRIKQGIPLQSDPTIIYAWQDYSIRRVLNKHKNIDSPYNTYKVRGLPPGPICIPSIAAIDGVLNYDKHNYLYFCAKADFSGYHSFARNLSQHNKNARLYQQALDKRKIYK